MRRSRSVHFLAVVVVTMTLPSCVAANFLQSQYNAYKLRQLDQVPERLGINVWPDAKAVDQHRRVIWDRDSFGDQILSGVVAPPWSYGGMAVGLAGMLDAQKAVYPELRVGAFSLSGFPIVVLCDGDALLPLEKQKDDLWNRFVLPPEKLSRLRTTSVEVKVEAHVGDWVFRLTPGYLEGLEAALARYKLAFPAVD